MQLWWRPPRLIGAYESLELVVPLGVEGAADVCRFAKLIRSIGCTVVPIYQAVIGDDRPKRSPGLSGLSGYFLCVDTNCGVVVSAAVVKCVRTLRYQPRETSFPPAHLRDSGGNWEPTTRRFGAPDCRRSCSPVSALSTSTSESSVPLPGSPSLTSVPAVPKEADPVFLGRLDTQSHAGVPASGPPKYHLRDIQTESPFHPRFLKMSPMALMPSYHCVGKVLLRSLCLFCQVLLTCLLRVIWSSLTKYRPLHWSLRLVRQVLLPCLQRATRSSWTRLRRLHCILCLFRQVILPCLVREP